MNEEYLIFVVSVASSFIFGMIVCNMTSKGRLEKEKSRRVAEEESVKLAVQKSLTASKNVKTKGAEIIKKEKENEEIDEKNKSRLDSIEKRVDDYGGYGK